MVMVMCVICSTAGGNQTSDDHVCDLSHSWWYPRYLWMTT